MEDKISARPITWNAFSFPIKIVAALALIMLTWKCSTSVDLSPRISDARSIDVKEIVSKADFYSRRPAFSCKTDEVNKQARHFLKAKEKYSKNSLGCADPVQMNMFLTTLWDPWEASVTLVNVGANKGYNIAEWFELWLPHLSISPHSWGLDFLQSKYSENFNEWLLCGACSDCKKSPIKWSHMSGRFQKGGDANTNLLMIAVEPSEANFQILQDFQTFANFSNFKVLQYAVSNSTGTASFPITRMGSEVGSLASSASRFNFSQVKLLTLDALWEEQNLTTVDLLKIDTEGFDALVLEGGASILKNQQVKLLEFEYHGIGPWTKIKLETVVEKLDSYGYDCYLKVPSSTLVRLTHCFHSAYEFHYWSNVVCASRREAQIGAFLLSHARWL